MPAAEQAPAAERPSRRPLLVIVAVLAVALAAAVGLGQCQANSRSDDLDRNIEQL